MENESFTSATEKENAPATPKQVKTLEKRRASDAFSPSNSILTPRSVACPRKRPTLPVNMDLTAASSTGDEEDVFDVTARSEVQNEGPTESEQSTYQPFAGDSNMEATYLDTTVDQGKGLNIDVTQEDLLEESASDKSKMELTRLDDSSFDYSLGESFAKSEVAPEPEVKEEEAVAETQKVARLEDEIGEVEDDEEERQSGEGTIAHPGDVNLEATLLEMTINQNEVEKMEELLEEHEAKKALEEEIGEVDDNDEEEGQSREGTVAHPGDANLEATLLELTMNEKEVEKVDELKENVEDGEVSLNESTVEAALEYADIKLNESEQAQETTLDLSEQADCSGLPLEDEEDITFTEETLTTVEVDLKNTTVGEIVESLAATAAKNVVEQLETVEERVEVEEENSGDLTLEEEDGIAEELSYSRNDTLPLAEPMKMPSLEDEIGEVEGADCSHVQQEEASVDQMEEANTAEVSMKEEVVVEPSQMRSLEDEIGELEEEEEKELTTQSQLQQEQLDFSILSEAPEVVSGMPSLEDEIGEIDDEVLDGSQATQEVSAELSFALDAQTADAEEVEIYIADNQEEEACENVMLENETLENDEKDVVVADDSQIDPEAASIDAFDVPNDGEVEEVEMSNNTLPVEASEMSVVENKVKETEVLMNQSHPGADKTVDLLEEAGFVDAESTETMTEELADMSMAEEVEETGEALPSAENTIQNASELNAAEEAEHLEVTVDDRIHEALSLSLEAQVVEGKGDVSVHERTLE
uniref:BRCT domain-containing protein n=1 Tax=Steinernema glaseri TaxID=37863 RepID=A0A1I8ACM6_9BILA